MLTINSIFEHKNIFEDLFVKSLEVSYKVLVNKTVIDSILKEIVDPLEFNVPTDLSNPDFIYEFFTKCNDHRRIMFEQIRDS